MDVADSDTPSGAAPDADVGAASDSNRRLHTGHEAIVDTTIVEHPGHLVTIESPPLRRRRHRTVPCP